MGYKYFEYLTRRTTSDKILRDKGFNIPKKGLNMIDTKFFIKKLFDKKTSATLANKFAGSGINNENMSDQQLAEELHKPIIRKFNKEKV